MESTFRCVTDGQGIGVYGIKLNVASCVKIECALGVSGGARGG